MDQIKQMMDQLSDITDEQVSELQTSILSEFESVEKEDPTPQIVDAMTSLADMLDGVRNEVMRRETAAKELAQRAAEAANRVHGQDGEAADKSMDEENPDAAPADAEAPAAPVEEMPKEEVAAAPMEEEAPVADAPVAEEAPMDEKAEETDTEEDTEKKDKKEYSMTESTTNAEKNSEFSTENAEAAPVAEATTEVAAEVAAPVAEEAPAAE